MDINTINEQVYADLFGDSAVKGAKTGVHFGAENKEDIDILSTTDTTTVSSTTDTTTVLESTTDTTTQPSTTDTTTLDTDILGTEGKKEKETPGRKPKYDFSDASGYFEDRMKTGKFVKIEEDTEDGKRLFIPKTPEDFDEVIDMQVNYKLEQERKSLAEKLYNSKSPAWQAVLKYSELVDDPSEVLPFIVGVKNIDSVKDLDPSDIDSAEKIVRTRLEQRGESVDIIDEQIESLKTTDKLVSTAQKYKPVILQEESQRLSQMMQEQKLQEEEYRETVMSIKDNAIKAIEAPIFGKQKLKQEEKAIVYELIAVPSEESGGYPIYSAIDELFQRGDFETLKQVALLVAKKENFLGYVSSGAADKTAEGLQKKLRVANESRAGGSDTMDSGDTPVVQRQRYTSKFGSGK